LYGTAGGRRNIHSAIQLLKRTLLCAAALVSLTMLHECAHWLIARGLGLHPFFRNLTTVGFNGHVTNAQSLEFSDIPVLLVFVVGVAAAVLLSRRLPEWLLLVFGWWAVLGLAYPGIEAMVAPLGHCQFDSDFSCVADSLSWSAPMRALAATFGAVWCLGSGWLLRLPGESGQPRRIPRVVTGILAALAAADMLRTLAIHIRAITRGLPGHPLAVLILWPAVCILAIPWTRESVARLLLGWLAPLLLAAVLLSVWSTFQPSEFSVIPFMVLPPLASALWRNHRAAAA